MDKIPPEVLCYIFTLAYADPTFASIYDERAANLCSFSLVCRLWSSLAQPLLLKAPFFCGDGDKGSDWNINVRMKALELQTKTVQRRHLRLRRVGEMGTKRFTQRKPGVTITDTLGVSLGGLSLNNIQSFDLDLLSRLENLEMLSLYTVEIKNKGKDEPLIELPRLTELSLHDTVFPLPRYLELNLLPVLRHLVYYQHKPQNGTAYVIDQLKNRPPLESFCCLTDSLPPFDATMSPLLDYLILTYGFKSTTEQLKSPVSWQSVVKHLKLHQRGLNKEDYCRSIVQEMGQRFEEEYAAVETLTVRSCWRNAPEDTWETMQAITAVKKVTLLVMDDEDFGLFGGESLVSRGFVKYCRVVRN